MATRALELAQVRVHGALDARIRRGLHHLREARATILAYGGWGGDQYGRWLPAVALSDQYLGAQRDLPGDELQAFLRTQDASGMFGEAPTSMTLWWGAGRALIGLVEYWEIAREAQVLQAARRLGDLYLEAFPLAAARRNDQPGATHYQSGIEGLVALWRVTGQGSYLSLAERIMETIDPEFGEPWGQQHRHHTHGYLCALRGVLDIYAATGEPSRIRFVRRCWDHILARHMWVTGGISEVSTNPFEHRDETCSVADWLRLSLRLWQATGESRYMEVAEHTLINHLYFGQDYCGGFCQYRSLQDQPTGVYRDSLAWYCCSMHGQRALLEAVRNIYTWDATGIDINLFHDSTAQVRLPSHGDVALEQKTRWPHEVHVEIRPETEEPFQVRLRIPHWSRTSRVSLNGDELECEGTAGLVTLDRVWRPGDTLQLRLDPAFRLVPEGTHGISAPDGSPRRGVPGQRHRRAAMLYGPFVLMIDLTLDRQLAPCPRFELAIPVGDDGEPAFAQATDALLDRGPLAVTGTCLEALGREVTPGAEDQGQAGPWKRIRLVPISEISDREGRQTDLFSTEIGEREGRMTNLYKVRHDVWLLDQRSYSRLVATGTPNVQTR